MTVVAFLFRIRIIVLIAAALATAAAAEIVIGRYALPVGAIFLSGATLVAAATCSFLFLRHAGLSAIAAISPLPGMIVTAPLALDAGVALPELIALYGLGLCSSVSLAGEMARGILAGDEAMSAARLSLLGALMPAFGAVTAGAAFFLVWFGSSAPMLAFESIAVLASPLLSVLAIDPFAASLLSYGEQFVVDANRARAFTEDLFRIAAMVAVPRWAMSVCGIAIVFAVLGWFASGDGSARSARLDHLLLWAASAVVFFVLALVLRRDWRHALAATLTAGALVLTATWMWDLAGARLSASFPQTLLIAVIAFLFLNQILFGLAAIRRKQGDLAGIARARAIEDGGPAVAMSAVGAAVVILPWTVIHGTIALVALEFLIAGVSSLLVAPSLESMIESLLPRRQSAIELYGRR